MELTNRISIAHATVTFPDGSTESVEYVEQWHEGDTLVLYDLTDDAWYVSVGYKGEDIYLKWKKMESEKTTYSIHNFEKIEVDWTENLVAVCEIDESAFIEQESKWLGLRNVETYSKPDDYEMPDVTLWEDFEWEAHKESQ